MPLRRSRSIGAAVQYGAEGRVRRRSASPGSSCSRRSSPCALTAGWSVADVAAGVRELRLPRSPSMILPFAKLLIAEHRAAGDLLAAWRRHRRLAFTEPLARALGFDGVDRDRVETRRRSPTRARSTARVRLGAGQGARRRGSGRPSTGCVSIGARRTATATSTHRCWHRVGQPVVGEPRRAVCGRPWPRSRGWPVRHTSIRAEGVAQESPVASCRSGGRPLDAAGDSWRRTRDIVFDGSEARIPSVRAGARGVQPPVVLRPHGDGAGARAGVGRNVRGLGKKEVFDVPTRRPARRRASGGDPGRAWLPGPTSRSSAATRAPSRAGELVMIAPGGHDPTRSGLLRAGAEGSLGCRSHRWPTGHGAPVIPVGLCGAPSRCGPAASRLPDRQPADGDRPLVTATVGAAGRR